MDSTKGQLPFEPDLLINLMGKNWEDDLWMAVRDGRILNPLYFTVPLQAGIDVGLALGLDETSNPFSIVFSDSKPGEPSFDLVMAFNSCEAAFLPIDGTPTTISLGAGQLTVSGSFQEGITAVAYTTDMLASVLDQVAATSVIRNFANSIALKLLPVAVNEATKLGMQISPSVVGALKSATFPAFEPSLEDLKTAANTLLLSADLVQYSLGSLKADFVLAQRDWLVTTKLPNVPMIGGMTPQGMVNAVETLVAAVAGEAFKLVLQALTPPGVRIMQSPGTVLSFLSVLPMSLDDRVWKLAVDRIMWITSDPSVHEALTKERKKFLPFGASEKFFRRTVSPFIMSRHTSWSNAASQDGTISGGLLYAEAFGENPAGGESVDADLSTSLVEDEDARGVMSSVSIARQFRAGIYYYTHLARTANGPKFGFSEAGFDKGTQGWAGYTDCDYGEKAFNFGEWLGSLYSSSGSEPLSTVIDVEGKHCDIDISSVDMYVHNDGYISANGPVAKGRLDVVLTGSAVIVDAIGAKNANLSIQRAGVSLVVGVTSTGELELLSPALPACVNLDQGTNILIGFLKGLGYLLETITGILHVQLFLLVHELVSKLDLNPASVIQTYASTFFPDVGTTLPKDATRRMLLTRAGVVDGRLNFFGHFLRNDSIRAIVRPKVTFPIGTAVSMTDLLESSAFKFPVLTPSLANVPAIAASVKEDFQALGVSFVAFESTQEWMQFSSFMKRTDHLQFLPTWVTNLLSFGLHGGPIFSSDGQFQGIKVTDKGIGLVLSGSVTKLARPGDFVTLQTISGLFAGIKELPGNVIEALAGQFKTFPVELIWKEDVTSLWQFLWDDIMAHAATYVGRTEDGLFYKIEFVDSSLFVMGKNIACGLVGHVTLYPKMPKLPGASLSLTWWPVGEGEDLVSVEFDSKWFGPVKNEVKVETYLESKWVEVPAVHTSMLGFAPTRYQRFRFLIEAVEGQWKGFDGSMEPGWSTEPCDAGFWNCRSYGIAEVKGVAVDVQVMVRQVQKEEGSAIWVDVPEVQIGKFEAQAGRGFRDKTVSFRVRCEMWTTVQKYLELNPATAETLIVLDGGLIVKVDESGWTYPKGDI